MEEYSYTSTHPLGHTGPVTGKLYLYLYKINLNQTFLQYFPTHKQLARGSTVVKVLCYKSEGRWFDPSWCHWNFSLT